MLSVIEVHVIHDIGASKIVGMKVDFDQCARSGNMPPVLCAGKDADFTYYRLSSWPEGKFAADSILVYVSEELSDEQAHIAELDHWERLKRS